MSKQQRPSIIIYGAPNTGKTSALRKLGNNPEKAKRILYINGDNKALPWYGGNLFQRYTLLCPTLLPQVIRSAAASGAFDVIIVDTLTRVMETFASRFIGSNEPKYTYNDEEENVSDMDYVAITRKGEVDGMKGWQRYGALIRDIFDAGDASECQMVYMSHMALRTQEDGSMLYEAPLQGQVGKSGLVGNFSIALVAGKVKVEDVAREPKSSFIKGTGESLKGTGERFVMHVRPNEHLSTLDFPIRAITGTFPEDVNFMDNDLTILLDHLDSLATNEEEYQVTF